MLLVQTCICFRGFDVTLTDFFLKHVQLCFIFTQYAADFPAETGNGLFQFVKPAELFTVFSVKAFFFLTDFRQNTVMFFSK